MISFKQIVYQAAIGEKVFINGSERITSWTDWGDGDLQVEIPNTLFWDYNPNVSIII